MGWKALKDKFGIHHIVEVSGDDVCISSGYVSNIVTINSTTGIVNEKETNRGFLQTSYPALLAATPFDLVKLINMPDTFFASIAVYTVENDVVIEKHCEELGWPNVTHDGCVMYGNTYSPKRELVIEWEKSRQEQLVQHFRKEIERVEIKLSEMRIELTRHLASQANFQAVYPTIKQT